MIGCGLFYNFFIYKFLTAKYFARLTTKSLRIPIKTVCVKITKVAGFT